VSGAAASMFSGRVFCFLTIESTFSASAVRSIEVIIRAVKTRTIFWFVYPVWIAICAVLFVAVADLPDPSKKSDRIENELAGERALAILKASDPVRFANYEAVHVSYAKRNEVSPESRWLILCDDKDRTGLRDAVVVHLRAIDGVLRDVRKLDSRYAEASRSIRLPAAAAAAATASGGVATR
jgi:hypothetical protein